MSTSNSISKELDLSTIPKAISSFNALPLIENSEDNHDEGVMEVLITVSCEPFTVKLAVEKLRANKKITKDKVMAAIAFLQSDSLADVRGELRSQSIDNARNIFVKKYVHLSPTNCGKCNNIFACHTREVDVQCLVSDKGLCPTCCPDSESNKSFLFPVCSSCSSGLLKQKNHEGDVEPPPVTLEETIVPTVENNSATAVTSVSTSQSTADPEPKICSFYMRNACRFGRKGEGCQFSHPKQCFQWLKAGPKGCSKGKDCDYHHTKICSGSLKDLFCFKESCRFTHLPKTVRKSEDPTAVLPASRPDTRTSRPDTHTPRPDTHTSRPATHTSRPATHTSQRNPRKSTNSPLRNPTVDFQLTSVPPPPDNLGEILRTLSAQSSLLNSLALQVSHLTKESQEKKLHVQQPQMQQVSYRDMLTAHPAQSPQTINGITYYPQNPHQHQGQSVSSLVM
jgi:hypothetical protein